MTCEFVWWPAIFGRFGRRDRKPASLKIITSRGGESIANRTHYQINIACRGFPSQGVALFYLKVGAILYSKATTLLGHW